MDSTNRRNNRKWQVLCWNIRGINSSNKWSAVKSKINESACDIVCLQETKRASFDQAYVKNFCPPSFDRFEYAPSTGASGGRIIAWKSSKFSAHVVFKSSFAISIECTSVISCDTWILTNVYAPCTSEDMQSFLDWFKNIAMPDDMDWLIIGDFNLIRKQTDRNKPGDNIQDMLKFNNAISYLRLEELRLTGQKFTWTNKQESPLLERLDWHLGLLPTQDHLYQL
jgi:exonuclease III